MSVTWLSELDDKEKEGSWGMCVLEEDSFISSEGILGDRCAILFTPLCLSD